MLVKKIWVTHGRRTKWVRWIGYYLFGFIPVYVKQDSLDEP